MKPSTKPPDPATAPRNRATVANPKDSQPQAGTGEIGPAMTRSRNQQVLAKAPPKMPMNPSPIASQDAAERPQQEHPQRMPATVNDAVIALLAMLTEDTKAEICARDRDQLIELHFGFGTWIRNHFDLWQGDSALAQDAGCSHPDDVAGAIIEALWNRLRGAKSRQDYRMLESSTAASRCEPAPSPDEFRLTGSDRTSDLATAIGQQDSFGASKLASHDDPAQRELFENATDAERRTAAKLPLDSDDNVNAATAPEKALADLTHDGHRARAPKPREHTMRANSRYAAIARQSLKKNQPGLYCKLEASGRLETFLAKRAQDAQDMATDIHQRNLAAGVQPGTSAAEADNQAIRDNLLFRSKEEQESDQDGYHDP
jgi:Domain of unknown function (DUF6794)